MATKAEMIHWLTTNEPDVSKYQKIETAHDERILRLYIEYHGRADTWETLTASEKQKVLDAIVAIGIARAGMPILANTFNLSSMQLTTHLSSLIETHLRGYQEAIQHLDLAKLNIDQANRLIAYHNPNTLGASN